MNITANNLSFKTLRSTILDGVSFTFEVGQKTAFYGPKNSGKKALLLILGGYLKPTHGSVCYGDLEIWKNLKIYRQDNGLTEVKGVNQLVEEMTVKENILYSAKLYHVSIDINEILDKFGLKIYADTPVAEVGQYVRSITALVCATVNNQQKIFLDEPSENLTDEESQKYWEVLDNNFSDKKIFYTTKNLVEAKRANQIFWLERGRLKQN